MYVRGLTSVRRSDANNGSAARPCDNGQPQYKQCTTAVTDLVWPYLQLPRSPRTPALNCTILATVAVTGVAGAKLFSHELHKSQVDRAFKKVTNYKSYGAI